MGWNTTDGLIGTVYTALFRHGLFWASLSRQVYKYHHFRDPSHAVLATYIALISRKGSGQRSMQLEYQDLLFLRLKCPSSEEFDRPVSQAPA
jgi:uncharacterized protein YjlB